jgi:hypothetical protein
MTEPMGRQLPGRGSVPDLWQQIQHPPSPLRIHPISTHVPTYFPYLAHAPCKRREWTSAKIRQRISESWQSLENEDGFAKPL